MTSRSKLSGSSMGLPFDQTTASIKGASRTSTAKSTIAAERWNVEKKRAEYDARIETFYDREVQKCLRIDQVANERATKLYNDIYHKAKWSAPPFPAVYRKLILDYCKHVLTEGTAVKFPHVADLKVWHQKTVGTVHQKCAGELEGMMKKMWHIIEKRDKEISELQLQLLNATEEMNIKKDGELRWMMEGNKGKRDEYFSIWYLAANNKVRELEVLLSSTRKMQQYSELGINEPDPDFGMTPLHYACRNQKLGMVQFLLQNGADISTPSADGRTPLHYAAQYSTREIVLDLLAAGASLEAVDDVGCTALDLALQNRNANTSITLQRWVQLVPLDEIVAELDDERESYLSQNLQDESLIPPEYRSVDPEVYERMSPTLRLLTKRLDAYNSYLKHPLTGTGKREVLAHSSGGKAYAGNMNANAASLTDGSSSQLLTGQVALENTVSAVMELDDTTSEIQRSIDKRSRQQRSDFSDAGGELPHGITPEINECLVEIRLTTKHYALCVQEKLSPEAMRSLRRRWLVAKRLWLLILEHKYLEQQKASKEKQEQAEVMEKLMLPSELRSTALYEVTDSAVETNAAIQSHDDDSENPVALDASLSPPEHEPLQLPNTPDASGKVVANADDAVVAAATNSVTSPNEAIVKQQLKRPLDLEQIALLFDSALARRMRDEEEYRRIRQASDGSPLRRDREYDSLGIDVYRVADNVFWEKPSDDDVGNMMNNEHEILPSAMKSESYEAIERSSTDAGDKFASTDAIADGTPQRIGSSRVKLSAAEIIGKWQSISQKKSENQPFFDIYYGVNDEVISTGSSLTQTAYLRDAQTTTGVQTAALSSSLSLANTITTAGYDSHAGSSAHLYRSGLRGNYVTHLGLELFQVHLARGEESLALVVLEDCLRITMEVEDTVRIKMLSKKCDLLVQLHDHIRSLPAHRSAVVAEEETKLMSARSCTIVEVLQRCYPDEGKRHIVEHAVEQWKQFLEKRRQQQKEADSRKVIDFPPLLSSATKQMNAVAAPHPDDQLQLQTETVYDELREPGAMATCPVNSEMKTTSLLPPALVTEVTERLSKSDLNPFKSLYLDASTDQSLLLICNPYTEQLSLAAQKELLQCCIVQSLVAANESIALHRHLFENGIAEPQSLAELLVQKAKVAERAHFADACFVTLQEAESCAVRAVAASANVIGSTAVSPQPLTEGSSASSPISGLKGIGAFSSASLGADDSLSTGGERSVENISMLADIPAGNLHLAICIMLESLRVYIKYRLRDEQDLRYIGQKVEEINKYVLQYSFINILEADKLQKRAVELLSLSGVALDAAHQWEIQETKRKATELRRQQDEIIQQKERIRTKNKKKLTRGMKTLSKS